MRRACLLAVALLAMPVARAAAAWAPSGSGSGAAGAKSMPAGNVPTASALLSNVTVSWAASSFAGGPAVAGYVVKRYDALTGTPQTVLAACSGTVSATTCAENGVPVGTWTYTVTPAQGSWRGAQSGQSSPVIVL